MIVLTASVQQFSYSCKSFKTVPTVIGFLLTLILTLFVPERSHSKEFEVLSIGVRAAVNFKVAGLPPGEKENFEQFDVFGIMSLPWRWDYLSSGWELRTRLNGSAGVLRGAGETAFITTMTPGLALRRPGWGLILDAGIGGALISSWKFGDQDIGGPFQFIAHAGVSFELPWNLVVGGRFHHMSDGTIYGDSRGVDFYMLELSYYFGD